MTSVRDVLSRAKYRLPARWALGWGLPRRVLVVRRGAIGDVLMMTPALRGLRHRYPGAEIVVWTKYPELFELNPSVNGARRSVNPAAFDRWIWMKYEDRLPLREHIIDLFCRCAGVPPQGRELDLFFGVAEHRAARERLEHLERPYVVLQPWAGTWTPNKHWAAERWEQVTERLRTAHDLEVVQLGTKQEAPIRGAVDWRGATTLREAALIIHYALLHLGCNSGGQQLAHAVGTPAVALYGTTHPVCSGYPEQVCLYGGDTATPCYHRDPCEHHASMEAIEAADVLAAAERLLRCRTVVSPGAPTPGAWEPARTSDPELQ